MRAQPHIPGVGRGHRPPRERPPTSAGGAWSIRQLPGQRCWLGPPHREMPPSPRLLRLTLSPPRAPAVSPRFWVGEVQCGNSGLRSFSGFSTGRVRPGPAGGQLARPTEPVSIRGAPGPQLWPPILSPPPSACSLSLPPAPLFTRAQRPQPRPAPSVDTEAGSGVSRRCMTSLAKTEQGSRAQWESAPHAPHSGATSRGSSTRL